MAAESARNTRGSWFARNASSWWPGDGAWFLRIVVALTNHCASQHRYTFHDGSITDTITRELDDRELARSYATFQMYTAVSLFGALFYLFAGWAALIPPEAATVTAVIGWAGVGTVGFVTVFAWASAGIETLGEQTFTVYGMGGSATIALDDEKEPRWPGDL